MKKILLALVSFVFMVGCASTMYGKKGTPDMMSFEKIVDIPNQTKADLYTKTNVWFVETFNSAQSVIQYQDKDAGKIMGKYVFSYSESLYYFDVEQTISIDIKDNKIKILINDPSIRVTGDMLNGSKSSGSYSPLETITGLEKAQLEWNKISKSLILALSKGSDF